tara:strand:+ start:261 stop:428 length:168 start_codon:yes stop_codon:yes gene_type:complete
VSNLKTGDVVTVENITGRIIRFQPKTQDVIVKDDHGDLHTFLHTELINAASVKNS